MERGAPYENLGVAPPYSGGGGSGAGGGGHPKVVVVSATTQQLPVYCVQADYPVVSLSLDAAWGNEDTQTLIDMLDKYQVKALHEAGHEIMEHSDDHAHFNSLTPEQIKENLTTSQLYHVLN